MVNIEANLKDLLFKLGILSLFKTNRYSLPCEKKYLTPSVLRRTIPTSVPMNQRMRRINISS